MKKTPKGQFRSLYLLIEYAYSTCSGDSSATVVWRANRANYVDENATVSYLTTGAIELRDSNGSLVQSAQPCSHTVNSIASDRNILDAFNTWFRIDPLFSIQNSTFPCQVSP